MSTPPFDPPPFDPRPADRDPAGEDPAELRHRVFSAPAEMTIQELAALQFGAPDDDPVDGDADAVDRDAVDAAADAADAGAVPGVPEVGASTAGDPVVRVPSSVLLMPPAGAATGAVGEPTFDVEPPASSTPPPASPFVPSPFAPSPFAPSPFAASSSGTAPEPLFVDPEVGGTGSSDRTEVLPAPATVVGATDPDTTGPSAPVASAPVASPFGASPFGVSAFESSSSASPSFGASGPGPSVFGAAAPAPDAPAAAAVPPSGRGTGRPRDTAPRRQDPRRLALLGGLGAVALLAVGYLALSGGSGDEVAPGVVVAAAPTTDPNPEATTSPAADDPAPAVGRNVFEALVVADPTDDGADGAAADGSAAGGSGAAAPSAPQTVITATGDSGVLSTATPFPTPTATVTVAAPSALSARWTGTTTVDGVVAQVVEVTTGSGTATATVAPGAVLGTVAPLSWFTSQGVGADGTLLLVAGSSTYQLTQGVSTPLV